MKLELVKDEISEVLITKEQIESRLSELAREVEAHYKEKDVLLVGVLRGAVIVLADFVRELDLHASMDWMALSSYGSGTKSSGVVRILKDLDTDVTGRDVLIIEDIIDSGLTLQWLHDNLVNRGANSVEILALLRKPAPDGADEDRRIQAKWVGFDIPDEFVVGYGLDYAEKYRNLPFVGILAHHIYE